MSQTELTLAPAVPSTAEGTYPQLEMIEWIRVPVDAVVGLRAGSGLGTAYAVPVLEQAKSALKSHPHAKLYIEVLDIDDVDAEALFVGMMFEPLPDHFARVAVVSGSLRVAGIRAVIDQLITGGTTRYFLPNQRDDALTWLAE